MDAKELAEALAKSLAPITATLATLTADVAALKAAPPKTEEKKPEEKPVTKTEEVEVDATGRPLFKGKLTDTLAVIKHQRAVEDFELAKAFEGEMGNAESVRELVAAQRKLAELRKAEDGQLGLPSGDSVGQSLRKQLAGGTNGTPTMLVPGQGEWMTPTDPKASKQIIAEAESLIKSRYGKVKGEKEASK